MIVELSPEERQNVEAEARKVVAGRNKIAPESIEVTAFDWNDEFENYDMTLKFEKDGRLQNAVGHVETSEVNGRATHRFVYDAGSGPGV